MVSGDTGIAHLATGYATPSVVLLRAGAADAVGGPPPDRPWHQALWVGRRLPADDGVHPALAALDVPAVLAAVERCLSVREGLVLTPPVAQGSLRTPVLPVSRLRP